jgi:hypothetical protein
LKATSTVPPGVVCLKPAFGVCENAFPLPEFPAGLIENPFEDNSDVACPSVMPITFGTVRGDEDEDVAVDVDVDAA